MSDRIHAAVQSTRNIIVMVFLSVSRPYQGNDHLHRTCIIAFPLYLTLGTFAVCFEYLCISYSVVGVAKDRSFFV